MYNEYSYLTSVISLFFYWDVIFFFFFFFGGGSYLFTEDTVSVF